MKVNEERKKRRGSKIMKKIIAVAIVALLMLGLCACGDNTVNTPPQGQNGMYTSSQGFSGGTEMQGINLKNIEVGADSITVSFVSGSGKIGIAETAISGVPAFEISNTGSPRRMIIKVSSLKYFDSGSVNVTENPLIEGVFKQLPQNSESTYIYIQLKNNYEYLPTVTDGTLKITFKAIEEGSEKKYYVAMDAFSAYSAMRLPETLEYKPSLCSDGSSVVLLSKAFATEAEANTELLNVTAAVTGIVDAGALRVVELFGNDLPMYDESVNIDYLNSMKLALKGGNTVSGSIFYADAKFICWDKDLRRALFTKPTGQIASNGEGTVDELWYADKEGAREKVTDKTVSSVTQAEFSPSGRYIAFAEQSEGMMVLSVLDTQTGMIANTSEEGLGTYCTGFGWDQSNDVLYACVGEGIFTVRSYDPANGAMETLAESYFGKLEVVGNKLAYISAISGSTRLTLYDITTKQVEHIAAAMSFSVSPDGNYAALETISEEGGTDLKVLRIGGDEVKPLASDADMINMFWTEDGKLVYLLGEDSEFPIAMYSYDIATGTTEKVMNLINGTVSSSNESGELIVGVMYNKKDNYYPVTFTVKI